MQIRPEEVCSHCVMNSPPKPCNIHPDSTALTQFSKEATRVLTQDTGIFCLCGWASLWLLNLSRSVSVHLAATLVTD